MGSPDSPLRINLGCGSRWAPGWCNVDGGPFARLVPLRSLPVLSRLLPPQVHAYPPDLIRLDLSRRNLPFPDGSAAAVFSGYMLEYLPPARVQPLLRECFRVLEPGGLIRLCQTDVQAVVEAYLAGRPAEPGPQAVENTRRFLALAAPEHTQLGVRLFRRGGVQQLFDRPSLLHLLLAAGFDRPAFRKWREGECPDLEAVERPERDAAPLLRVEARKPR